jgi:3-deoxy-D-manno-octulosonic-acid transferase
MRIVYNVLFSIGMVLLAPYYFFRLWRRGNWREGFSQRFGLYEPKIKQALTNRQTLWIHAVSVGEVNVATQLIKGLEPRVPNLKIVVSTTTSTGMGELKRKLPPHITRVYYPIDDRKYVARAVANVAPRALVLIEAEIWPNFIWRLKDRQTPLFLVNARLSERSYRGYRRLRWLFRPLFAAFSGVGAQTEADAVKLRQLGCRPEAIRVVGSLKYDAATLEERHFLDVPAMFQQLGVPEGAPILLGGSTHDGEEAILAEVFCRLRQTIPNLFLIVVPRHFERSRQVGRELGAHGLRFVFRSEIRTQAQYEPGTVDCLLVNTTGELRRFYQHASVIFVGKSLTAEGGQNPIEPAALGKPIVFGPHMQNFAGIAKAFVARGGARQVANAVELEKVVAELLTSEALRAEMGQQALQVVNENLGALERTVDMIVDHLRDGDLYIVERS